MEFRCASKVINILVKSIALAAFLTSAKVSADDLRITEEVDIAPVFSALGVGFDLMTTDKHQYVAFYDKDRRMTIAKRSLGSQKWQFTVLPSTVAWDSHNYIEMAKDDKGYLHISGNMHADPLVYFRSKKPYDISAFEQPGMVGDLEDRMTYPKFFPLPSGGLVYQYRIGGSGKGNTIWNHYNTDTKKWFRLTADGLFNGMGKVNAYHSIPKLGPDGFYHMVWMWRDTPVANTNHHLSHMKSRDLINWQTMAGDPVTLPITLNTKGVVSSSQVTQDITHGLTQSIDNPKSGEKTWILNPETLKAETVLKAPPPKGLVEIGKLISKFPDMQVHTEKDGDYVLRWETLKRNQDRPRKPPFPKNGMLKIYKLEATKTPMGQYE